MSPSSFHLSAYAIVAVFVEVRRWADLLGESDEGRFYRGWSHGSGMTPPATNATRSTNEHDNP